MTSAINFGIKLKFDGKDVEAGLSLTRDQVRALMNELRANASAGDVMERSIKRIGQLGAGAFGIGSVAAFGSAIIQAGLAAEKLNRQLAFSTGSSAAAAQEIEYLRKTTNALGVDFTTSAAAYGKLAAASKGTTLQGQETRNVFEAVAKASTVMGLSAGETEGALLAIQQMISKGTVSAEELRGQLGERLPGAFQVAARAMGVTTAELGKMLEQGQIATSDFLPRFAEELNRTLGDAPQSAAASAQANINRMTSAWESFKTSLANSGVLDAAANSLRILGAGLNSLDASELAKVARLQSDIANLELVSAGQKASGEDSYYTDRRIVSLRREIIVIQDKSKAEREAAQAAAEGRSLAARAAQNVLDREMQRARQTDPARGAADQERAEAALKAWGDSKLGTKVEENARKLAVLAKEYEAAYLGALKLGKSENELAQIITDHSRRAAEIIRGPADKEAEAVTAARADVATEWAKSRAKRVVDTLTQEREHFRIGTDEFVRQSIEAEDKALKAAIEGAQAKRKVAQQPAERIKLDAQINELEAQRNDLITKGARTREDATQRQQKDLLALQAAAGKVLDPMEAAAREFDKQWDETLNRALAEGGAVGQQTLDAYMQAWKRTVQGVDFGAASGKFDRVVKDAEAKIAALRADVAEGKISAVDAMVGEKRIRDEAVSDLGRLNDLLRQMAGSIDDPAVKAKMEEIAKSFHQARQAAADTNFADFWAGARKGADEYLATAANTAKTAANFTNRALQSMEDAWVNYATTGKASIRDLANVFIAEVARMAYRQSMAPMAAQLVSGATGIIGQALGFGPPKFADGGNHLGGLRIVGERGPELEATGPSRIFSAEQTRSIIAGATTAGTPQAMRIEVVNPPGRPAQVESVTQRVDAKGMVVSVVLTDIANNGPIAQGMAGRFGLRGASS